MAFTKIRIAVEKYAGKRTVFTPFVLVAGLTFAAVGTTLVLGGCTPQVPESKINKSTDNNSVDITDDNSKVDVISDVSTDEKEWSQIDTYNNDETAQYIIDTCAKFNKDISNVEAKDIAELAKKLSIFATHAKSDITNGASDSTLAKNKEVIIDANKADALLDKGSKEVKKQKKEEGLSDILLDLSTDYRICKSLRLTGATNGTVGDTITFKAQCTPENAEVKYEYKSSDTKIATVSQDGKVKLVSAGNVTITVTDKNTGVSDSRTIKVSKKAETTSSTEKKEESSESSKTESKKENSDGGSSSQSQKTEESSKPSSTPKQEVKATGVTLDYSSLSMTAGNGYELNAYILWSNGTSSYQGIQWSSSNNGVATVSGSGYVTAKSAGTATITASYGSFSKSCTVTVKADQVSQPSTPSGGGNGGNSGNGGSGNGGNSGNGGSGNGGSTSKPSGGGNGGNSGNGGSGNGGSTSKPSGGGSSSGDNGDNTSKPSGDSGSTETSKPETTPTVKDNSPRLTKDWLEANCNKVIASDGTVVYEIPQFVQYLNEYRAKEGQKPVTWHQVGGFTYKTYIEHLKESKNEYPAFMLSEEYPGCFDENGNIILTEAYFNKNILPQYSYNSMAEEAAHGQPHQYHSSCHFTFTPNMTINQYLEYLKNTESPVHYDNLTARSKHEIYVVGCFRGGSFTMVIM